MIERNFASYFLSILLFFSSGCVHYKLGNGHSGSHFSIHVAPIINHSQAHQVQGVLHRQLTREISNCPGLFLACAGNRADAILEVVIEDCERSVIQTDPANDDRVMAYRLRLRTLCSLRGKDDRLYFESQPIEGSLDIPGGMHFVDAQYQFMPRLTDDLAHRIVDLLHDPRWYPPTPSER